MENVTRSTQTHVRPSWPHHVTTLMKAINLSTKEETYYKSMYAAEQKLGIDVGMIKMVCEGLNNCKISISKIDDQRYTFEYC